MAVVPQPSMWTIEIQRYFIAESRDDAERMFPSDGWLCADWRLESSAVTAHQGGPGADLSEDGLCDAAASTTLIAIAKLSHSVSHSISQFDYGAL